MRVKCRLDRELPVRRSKERLCADPSAVHGPHPAASEKIIGI